MGSNANVESAEAISAGRWISVVLVHGRACTTLAAAQLLFMHAAPISGHPSDANYPWSCQDVDYNVEGGDRGASDFNSTHRGVRSSMFVTGSAAECVRVFSVAVLRTTTDEVVEFGWILGWGCDNSEYFHSPRVFMVKDTVLGGYTCRSGNFSPAGGTFPRFNVNDNDQDSIWSGQVDGTEYDTMNLPWATGTGLTNGERDGSVDSAWSNFKDIEERYADWSDWDNAQQFWDDDPDFIFCRWSDNHHGVEGPPCDTTA